MTATTLNTTEWKLNLAETLEQATEALEAHRAWMKGRAQNMVSPATQQEEPRPTTKPATWAMRSAPPPNVAAEQKGERSQSRSKSAAALATKTGEATPAEEDGHGRVQDHFYSSVQPGDQNLEGKTHPLLPEDGEGEPNPLPRVPREQKNARKPALSKKRSSSRSKVSPMSPGDSVQFPSVPTSPEVFIGQGGVGRQDSTQYPSAIKTAWGSVSQLDKYIEPLPTPAEGKERQEGGGNGQGSRSRNSGESTPGEGSWSRDASEEGGGKKGVSGNGGEAPMPVQEGWSGEVKERGPVSTRKGAKAPTPRGGNWSRDEEGTREDISGNGGETLPREEHEEEWREATSNGVASAEDSATSSVSEELLSGEQTLAASAEGEKRNGAFTDEGGERNCTEENRRRTGLASINVVGRTAILENTAVSTRVGQHLVRENGWNMSDGHVTAKEGGTVTGDAESFCKAPSELKQNASSVLGATSTPTIKSSAHTPDRASPEGVYIPSPRSHQSNSSYGGVDLDDSLTHQDHIRSLQRASSATLVAVSPAPKESRSSFAAHGLPKLSLAETSGKLYDFRADLKSPGSGASRGAHTMEANWLGVGRRSERSDFSDANLVNVLPLNSAAVGKDGERSIKPDSPGLLVGAKEFDDTRGSASDGSKSRQDHGADGAGSKVAHNGKQRSGVPPAALVDARHHRPSNVSSGETGIKNVAEPSMGSTSHDLSGETDIRQVRGEGVPSLVGGVLSHDVITPPVRGEADIEHMRAKDVPSSVGGVSSLHDVISPPAYSSALATPVSYNAAVKSVHSSTTSRTSSTSVNALKAIDLPPLRGVELTDVYLDGNELVKSLPPLKLLSPLSPHLTDFSLLGKRSRSPPEYGGHRGDGGVALAPPCPPYGVKQPQQVRVLNESQNTAAPPPLPNGHMTAASKPRPSSFGWSQSIGGGSLATATVPPRPASTRSKSLDETPRELATRLNRSSSTLVLSQAAPSEPASGRRGSSPVPVSPSSPVATQQFSFVGLPPGPGPLHIAAKCGNLRRLQSLLREGYDVDMPDQEGRTPLMYCVQSQGVHLGCADALINNGATVNRQTSDGTTAMHLAASIGAVSVIELLVLNGGKVDVQDFEGRSPLHWATLQKGTKTFSVLLKESVTGLHSTDDAGMTVLMWAAYNNNPTILSYLMDKGADTEEKDKDGYTAMHWAVHRDGSHCLQLLLKPDMTYFKDHRGKTVMHMAAEKGSMSACEVILKLRPDAIHDTDKMGRTPLHYAAACSRVDVSALLLDYGADAAHLDSTSRTPLHYAREKKLDYVVALLSCHGNAMADFVKASRSASLSSALSRSISFSQLPLPPRTSSPDQSADVGGSETPRSILSRSVSSVGEPGPASISLGESSDLSVGVGGYLGRFLPNEQEAVKHYYFRLNEQEGSICWCRSREGVFKSPNKALVLQVHSGPSNTVRKIPKFSPNDLHCYTFWVATGGGVLDLFAYNEDSFRLWVTQLEGVASRNSSAVGREAFKNSSVHSRPSSSLSVRSRASVVPAAGVSHDSHMTEASSSHMTGDPRSIFTVPPVSDGARPHEIARPESQKPAAARSSIFSVTKRAQIAPAQGTSTKPTTSTTVENFIGEDCSIDQTDTSDHVTYSGDII